MYTSCPAVSVKDVKGLVRPSGSSDLMLVLHFFFSSRRRHTRCSRDWSSDVCSSDLLLLPLYFTEAIDIHQFNKTLLVAPAPPAPPPPLASLPVDRSAAPKRSALRLEKQLVVPRVIPRQVARVVGEASGNDMGSATLLGEGAPGGVPGGLTGGVIGGDLSGPVPPSPIDSAPKSPIRVGGGVKAPRLIFGPEPVYPLLARHSKISGAVVIDAVIDTQGKEIGRASCRERV